MKRDMDLVRKLVFAIEAEPHGRPSGNPRIDGYTDEQIGYHLYLMMQDGLIDGNDISNYECLSPIASAGSLTWKGHEFADAARNDTLWNKAKAMVKEKAGSVSIAVMISYLHKLATEALGI